MFDIGFAELLVIGVVGLLVIGPDRLPETIRTAALWFGRLKRGLSHFREEFEQQIGADDIRRELRNESIMSELKKIEDDVGELKDSFNPDPQKAEQTRSTSTEQPRQTPLAEPAIKTATKTTAKKTPKAKPVTKPKTRPKSKPADHE